MTGKEILELSAANESPIAAASRVRNAVNGSQVSLEGRKQKLFAAGGLLAAMGAASCCVVPFALFMLGVSGAWIGNLTALEPYQPLFATLALGAIGSGFYLVHRRWAKAECADGSYCASPRSDRLAKTGLWTATALVAVALAFPRLAPLFL